MNVFFLTEWGQIWSFISFINSQVAQEEQLELAKTVPVCTHVIQMLTFLGINLKTITPQPLCRRAHWENESEVSGLLSVSLNDGVKGHLQCKAERTNKALLFRWLDHIPPPPEPIIRSLVPQLRSSINYFYGQENRRFMSQHRKKTANSHLGRWVQKVWSRQTSCVDWGHGTILRQSSQLSEGRSSMSRVPSSARYRRGGVRQRTCTPPTCPCSLRLGHLDDNDKLLL